MVACIYITYLNCATLLVDFPSNEFCGKFSSSWEMEKSKMRRPNFFGMFPHSMVWNGTLTNYLLYIVKTGLSVVQSLSHSNIHHNIPKSAQTERKDRLKRPFCTNHNLYWRWMSFTASRPSQKLHTTRTADAPFLFFGNAICSALKMSGWLATEAILFRGPMT